jgi:hypothetical protein
MNVLLRFTARLTTAAIFLSLLVAVGGVASADEPMFDPKDVVVYNSEKLPEAERSPDYRVSVNGKAVFCHKSYAYTSEQYFWETRPATPVAEPGKTKLSEAIAEGRPVTPLTYCSFDFQNKVQVKVSFKDPLRQAKDPVTEAPFIDTRVVDVRPLSAGINPPVTTVTQPDGSTNPGIIFTLDAKAPCQLVHTKTRTANSACQLSIEPGKQTKHPLHLFANPIETDVPVIDDSVKVMEPNNTDDPYHSGAEMKLSGEQDTLYFKPGVHYVNPISLKPDPNKQTPSTTIYVAGGAVVYLKPQYVPRATTCDPPKPCPPLPPTFACEKYPCPPRQLHNRSWIWIDPLIKSYDLSNIAIKGRGILSGKLALDGNPNENLTQRASLISLDGGEDGGLYEGHTVKVEGVTLDEPGDKALVFNYLNRPTAAGACPVSEIDTDKCRARVSNVKVIGHFGNTDAIVFNGTHNGIVQDSFAHNADNGMQVKSFARSTHNIEFRNNVIWSDAVGSFGLFGEAESDITKVRYHDSVVIHMTGGGVAPAVGLRVSGTRVKNTDDTYTVKAGNVSDFLFENITVEHISCKTCAPIKVINNWNDWTKDFYSTYKDDPYFPIPTDDQKDQLQINGDIRDIMFRNVHVLAGGNGDVVIEPYDTGTPIANVSFDMVTLNQRTITGPDDPHLYVNGRMVNTQTPVKWAGITNTSVRYSGCVVDDRGTCLYPWATIWTQP